MSLIVMLFVLVCGAVLQAVLPTSAALGEARAPMLLGLVLYYAFTRELDVSLQVAMVAGVLQDALCMIPLGFSSFCFCLCAAVVNRVKDEVFVHHWVTHLLFGAVGNLLVLFLLYGLLRTQGSLEMSLGALALRVPGSLIMGTVVVPVVFRATDALDQRLGMVEMRES